MSRFTESRSVIRKHVRFFEKTPDIVATQRALIREQFNPCLRIALTTCGDPRVDIECVVEDAFARLCGDWLRYQDEPEKALRVLVRRLAGDALRALPTDWANAYWYSHRYAELFADVADAEVLKGLRVIDDMPHSMKRTFEARRFYAFTMPTTALRLGVSINSVGTTKAECRISEVADLEAVLGFLAEQMGGGS
ncbi:hypothetical protein [Streptomyces sp. NPDC002215]|uniref:hypothetical protein n=1 Tax=Streptomyces sp. NPDC002215 TaxID=3154412 RepID=UPI00333268C7